MRHRLTKANTLHVQIKDMQDSSHQETNSPQTLKKEHAR